MKSFISTLTLVCIGFFAFAQTTHTYVANPGPNGKPSSVPWKDLAVLIENNDTKTWDMKFTCSLDEFVSASARNWGVASTREAVANVIKASVEVPYDPAVHGPLIEFNTGVNKATRKIEEIPANIPEGFLILVHPVFGPIAKSDCNNPLKPRRNNIVPPADPDPEPEDSIVYIPGKVDTVRIVEIVHVPADCAPQQVVQCCPQPVCCPTTQPVVIQQQPIFQQQPVVLAGGGYSYLGQVQGGGGSFVNTNTNTNVSYNNNSNHNTTYIPPASTYNPQPTATQPPPRPSGHTEARPPGVPQSGGCCDGPRPPQTVSAPDPGSSGSGSGSHGSGSRPPR